MSLLPKVLAVNVVAAGRSALVPFLHWSQFRIEMGRYWARNVSVTDTVTVTVSVVDGN